jgi:putative sigma-54 modulation protein
LPAGVAYGKFYSSPAGIPIATKERLMNLQLTGHHLEITPAIRSYLTTKLERLTRHFDHVIDVNVIMSVDKLQQRIEASVHVPGSDIFCESIDENMYAAIDNLVDKLDRQIIKHKEKVVGHRQNGPSRRAG